MTKKETVTAAQLLARLHTNPDVEVRQAQEDEERRRRAEGLRRAEAPLVAELRAAGHAVESVWGLVNTAAPYPRALPILLEHLSRSYPGTVREGIARALAVPEARYARHILTRRYREEDDPRAKDGLAVAIAATSDEDGVGEVIALAHDARQGPSRLLLLTALERSADPRARAALMDLGSDPELTDEIQVILGRLKRRNR